VAVRSERVAKRLRAPSREHRRAARLARRDGLERGGGGASQHLVGVRVGVRVRVRVRARVTVTVRVRVRVSGGGASQHQRRVLVVHQG